MSLVSSLMGLLWSGPIVTEDEREMLDELDAPTPQELENFVPEKFRALVGPNWTYTRGLVLSATSRSDSLLAGSLGGFELETSVREYYDTFYGVYGFYDHRRKVQSFFMKPTRNNREVRVGRKFIICFNRNSPREHHRFSHVRVNLPAP